MTIENFFLDARSVFTVVSLLTFLGIIWYSYSKARKSDYDTAANLPFADEPIELETVKMGKQMEKIHG